MKIYKANNNNIKLAATLLHNEGIVAFPTETVYGLGALGEAGVTKCLQIIQKELKISMALCGHTNINNVTKDIILEDIF